MSFDREREEPAVDVVMPVFEDERFIQEAIESVCSQSYTNINFYIIDNASGDQTLDIVKRMACLDNRIIIKRNPVNIGMVKNFNLAFSYGAADYVMLKSSNDLLEKSYIEKCMNLHRRYPDTSIAYTKVVKVDEQGYLLEPVPENHFFNTNDLDCCSAARIVMRLYSTSAPLWGVMKRERLAKCSAYPFCLGGDHVLVCEMALYGALRYVDEDLVERRVSEERSIYDLAILQSEIAYRGLSSESIFSNFEHIVPFISMVFAHLDMFSKAYISDGEKQQLFTDSIMILKNRFAHIMRKEIHGLLGLVSQIFRLLNDNKKNIVFSKLVMQLDLLLWRCRLIMPEHNELDKIKKQIDHLKSIY